MTEQELIRIEHRLKEFESKIERMGSDIVSQIQTLFNTHIEYLKSDISTLKNQSQQHFDREDELGQAITSARQSIVKEADEKIEKLDRKVDEKFKELKGDRRNSVAIAFSVPSLIATIISIIMFFVSGA